MLINYRTILLGLSIISSVLCAGPQDSYHGISPTTRTVAPTNSAFNPIEAALNWLTSTTNSRSSDGKSTSAASNLSTSWAGLQQTTEAVITTTYPAKAALDWLTSGLDDNISTPATTTDSKHSSIVSGILSELEATHTSTAAAKRVRLGFW